MEKNEIELVVSTPTIKGVAKYAEAIKEAEKSIGLIKPTIGNASLCAEEVTKTNKRKAEIKSALKKVSDMWDEPLKKALEPILEAQKSYEEKAKEYQAEVLGAKKGKAKEDAYGEFLDLLKLSVDGNAPDWDSFYEPGWYNMTKDQTRSAIIAKLADFSKKEEPDDPNEIAVFTFVGRKTIERVEKLLKDNLIDFKKEEI